MNKILRTGLLGALISTLAGCYTVPETGRSSFIIVTPAEELQLGVAAFTDLKAKEKVSTDVEANARVTRIGKRIAAAVGDALPGAKWEFVVFDEPKTVNAFALPGGKVGVYTGLINLASSDDEIAIVMGHEIGHVTARHGAERMSKGVLAGLGGAAPVVEKELTPAVSIRSSIKSDYIVCLEDGKKLKMLKRHLMTHYNLTPDEYRARWGLAADYPMVAPNYAEKRRELAKKIGLGRKPGASRGGRPAKARK